MDPEANKEPDKEVTAALAKAYAMLGYDRGSLAPREAELLKRGKLDLPGGWRTGGDKPVTETVEKNGVTIGLVHFPFLETLPTEETIGAVLKAADGLRSRVNLVVGMSPWGYAGENLLFQEGRDTGALDIVLGGGSGPASKGQFMAGGKTLWTRSDTKGKTVGIIHVLKLPGKGKKIVWRDKENIRPGFVGLVQEVPEAPGVAALFSAFPAE